MLVYLVNCLQSSHLLFPSIFEFFFFDLFWIANQSSMPLLLSRTVMQAVSLYRELWFSLSVGILLGSSFGRFILFLLGFGLVSVGWFILFILIWLGPYFVSFSFCLDLVGFLFRSIYSLYWDFLVDVLIDGFLLSLSDCVLTNIACPIIYQQMYCERYLFTKSFDSLSLLSEFDWWFSSFGLQAFFLLVLLSRVLLRCALNLILLIILYSSLLFNQ